ncbi:hypothetical protein E4T38_07806 [Aureobasidium subglaciale]|nr:hypothetical protein E4T38_07806 [Aureobasidium subglaciale]KAI5216668.1 hypothetical protein E4T40_07816 [Aureobasidium subglaciale]KAI5219988.1 hypothetical protein E4T41_07731 [Aureobasidium subglaciale]KAI5257787.1 hypothetical protein E4T46_07707 [Aureobasidium subglaciale]
MGIPHLTHSLSPYGDKVVLLQNPAKHENAIIDGPSLAYHVFYVCIARRTSARNALEAAPTYQELGQAAVDWLEQIEQYGLKILQSYANQLVTFRALNKEDLPSRMDNAKSSKSDVLGSVVSSNRLKALPAPPFLVPAIIEMLFESRYSSLVSVIPGEADAYCAEAARQYGGVIFTSDSDLLVHDLGESGKVILYRDLETIHLPSRGKCLKIQEYHPAAIAKRFELPNLVKLAFFMSQDHHKSLAENIRLAAKDTPMSAGFSEFADEYGSLPKLSKLAMARSSNEARTLKALAELDPRISEIVHLVRVKESDEAPSDLHDSNNLDMYLPFIIDDPTRTSAWRSGVSIRTQAYSLLRLLNPGITKITEQERKGTRVAGTLVDIDSTNDHTKLLEECLSSLQHDLEQHPSLSRAAKWRAVAAKLVCQSNLDNDKPPPLSNDLNRLVAGSRQGVLSWSFIHVSGQIQASLYSLRMLLQISTVIHSLLEGTGQDAYASLQSLITLLQDLPSLRELFDQETDTTEGEIEAAKTAVSSILQSLGITQDTAESSTKRKKKRKKKGEHTGDRTPPGVAWRSNNMFSNLAHRD